MLVQRAIILQILAKKEIKQNTLTCEKKIILEGNITKYIGRKHKNNGTSCKSICLFISKMLKNSIIKTF